MSEQKAGTWTMKIPVDRAGKYLTFQLKELGIDEYMAVQSFIEKKKWKEGIMLFITQTHVGGDDFKLLQKEFDANNIIPFNSSVKMLTDYLEPVPGELKKN
jgi:hypothetical protein